MKPKRERAASHAVATPSAPSAATASHGTFASSEPRNSGTPISVPSTTTARRPLRVGARPTIAAGSTPTASASPVARSLSIATAAGSA